MGEQETRDEGTEAGDADMSGAGREFREAMEKQSKRSADSDDPQDHVGHGCPLDPDCDVGDEEMPEGLAEALASVSAFLRGGTQADVHCVNVRTGERMVVHGTRDEVEEAIRAANDAADRQLFVSRVTRAACVTAAVVGVAVVGSLAAVGLVQLLRRRS